MGRNAQSGHPGHAGPTQVMQPPAGHVRELIEQAFGLTELLEGLVPERREDVWPSPIEASQHSHRLLGKVHDVRLGILRP